MLGMSFQLFNALFSNVGLLGDWLFYGLLRRGRHDRRGFGQRRFHGLAKRRKPACGKLGGKLLLRLHACVIIRRTPRPNVSPWASKHKTGKIHMA
jgi:hypothetical protein